MSSFERFLCSESPAEIRDLVWALTAPSLIKGTDKSVVLGSNFWASQCLELEKSIEGILADPQPFLTFFSSRRRFRLGLYFEDLILYFIQYISQYELLAHDLQVFSGGRTLGAFDFILRAPDGEVEHWEAAVKYFLQSRSSSEWGAWIGPNGRDSLKRKMGKMEDRQLLLSEKKESQELLKERKIPLPTRRRILSKGMLFQPFLMPEWPGPYKGDPAQPQGVWIRVMDFLDYLKASGKHSWWSVRLRPDWMAPSFAYHTTHLLSSSQLIGVFNGHTRAMMLSEMNETNEGFFETRRWFILTELWPLPMLEH